MRRCNVLPYEGNESYVFVSYCHKDRRCVFPIIEQMARDGYRIWYDEGINPGSEWPEVIARHLNGCAVCVAVVSQNSLESHNCRREINFALLKKKQLVSVVIEKVRMSLGMEMQLSSIQSIYKYVLPSVGDFFSELYKSSGMRLCLGEKNENIVVSDSSDYDEDEVYFQNNEKPIKTFSDKWFTGIDNDAGIFSRDIKTTQTIDSDESLCTEENNLYEKSNVYYWLTRDIDKSQININKSEFRIGRSNSLCDYTIKNNTLVSRIHAVINVRGDTAVLTDQGSKNHTFINSVRINPFTEYLLEDGEDFHIANERFIFHKTVVK